MARHHCRLPPTRPGLPRASCATMCCRGWRRWARPRSGCTWPSRRPCLSARWRRCAACQLRRLAPATPTPTRPSSGRPAPAWRLCAPTRCGAPRSPSRVTGRRHAAAVCRMARAGKGCVGVNLGAGPLRLACPGARQSLSAGSLSSGAARPLPRPCAEAPLVERRRRGLGLGLGPGQVS